MTVFEVQSPNNVLFTAKWKKKSYHKMCFFCTKFWTFILTTLGEYNPSYKCLFMVTLETDLKFSEATIL